MTSGTRPVPAASSGVLPAHLAYAEDNRREVQEALTVESHKERMSGALRAEIDRRTPANFSQTATVFSGTSSVTYPTSPGPLNLAHTLNST